MAADANFVGGRLRLAAFLRLVERHAPQRPTRFGQHVPLVREAVPGLDQGEAIYEGHEITTPGLQEDGHLPARSDADPERPVYANTEFHLPLLPVTTDTDPYKQSEFTNKSSIEDRPASGSPKQGKKLKHAMQGTNATGLSRVSRKPPSTRKRRIPVYGLALVQTTTSDGGLPDPSDASNSFGMEITEFDPIDDTQTSCSYAMKALASRPQISSTRVSARRQVMSSDRALESFNVQSTKKARHSNLNLPALPALIKSVQRQQVGLQFVADGFEPNELRTISCRIPRQRKMSVRRQDRPNTIAGGLALASGELPAPAAQTVDAFATLSDTTTLDLGRSTLKHISISSHLATTPTEDGRQAQR